MLEISISNLENPPSEWPEAFTYKEDVGQLELRLADYRWVKNVILVGNGGAITSFDAYYGALKPKIKSATVWTMEPDFIDDVISRFDKKSTIVVAVSKSGNTMGMLEALFSLAGYKVLAVTNPNEGILSQIAKKMKWPVTAHPPVGGRFSGGTSAAFVPAILCGINAKKIQEGISSGYSLKKEAYTLSKYLFELEKKGYQEVFVPIYSTRLVQFENLIVQLMHESVCKDGKGQTFYCSAGPECQHHTSQRFFGGKKNTVGLFIVAKDTEKDHNINIPDSLSDLPYKSSTLSVIDSLSAQGGVLAEFIGTQQCASQLGVPNVIIEVERVTEKSVGMLVGFWHMIAYYSALLRGVDAFDQPAVEESKNISFEEIRNLKK
ncbi:MAG: hypothetical protein OEV37_01175 [Candidatus Berkelbacteria bacterium]|nr:hypothetical protein [Candidatus Berkelbacteria bacterium]